MHLLLKKKKLGEKEITVGKVKDRISARKESKVSKNWNRERALGNAVSICWELRKQTQEKRSGFLKPRESVQMILINTKLLEVFKEKSIQLVSGRLVFNTILAVELYLFFKKTLCKIEWIKWAKSEVLCFELERTATDSFRASSSCEAAPRMCHVHTDSRLKNWYRETMSWLFIRFIIKVNFTWLSVNLQIISQHCLMYLSCLLTQG